MQKKKTKSLSVEELSVIVKATVERLAKSAKVIDLLILEKAVHELKVKIFNDEIIRLSEIESKEEKR